MFYVKRLDLIIPEYLNLLLKRPEFARWCEYVGWGSAREYCRVDTISQYLVSVPSMEEQKAVVNIVKSVVEKSGKGGTYFGATGCGKTYTMAFLARQLALRCTDVPEIGSPTIVMIVDRDELQKQGAKLFTKSKEFLNLGEVRVVPSRSVLRQELGARKSGGFYVSACANDPDRVQKAMIVCSNRPIAYDLLQKFYGNCGLYPQDERNRHRS